MEKTASPLRAQPLLKPHHITENPSTLLEHTPKAWRVSFIDDQDPANGVYVDLGKKLPVTFTMSLIQCAIVSLLYRIGIRAGTNSNGSKFPSTYARLRVGADPITLSRFFCNAGWREAVKTRTDRTDLRFPNLYIVSAGKPDTPARSTVIRHCERLAEIAMREGKLPEGVTASDFLDNLRALLNNLDLELKAREQAGEGAGAAPSLAA